MNLVVCLVIVGALLEAGGIALAVWEVRDRRRKVLKYQARPVNLRGSSFSRSEGTATLTSSGGGPPTLEQRLTTVEKAVAAVPASTRASAEQVRADAEHFTKTALNDVRGNLQAEVEGVRDLLLSVTAPTRGVWTSLGLLSVGLVVQTVANVLGAQQMGAQ